MVNVLISDSNTFYQYGMGQYISHIFQDELGLKVNICNNFNCESVSLANIIVIGLCKGEVYTCIPEFRHCRKSLIVGVIDDNLTPHYELPNCIESMVFIERKSSLDYIRSKIINLGHHQSFHAFDICINCRRKTLSLQQGRLMACMFLNKSISEIAKTLNVTDKTVYTHKYQIMQKFNLKTNLELITLLQKVSRNRNLINFLDCK